MVDKDFTIVEQESVPVEGNALVVSVGHLKATQKHFYKDGGVDCSLSCIYAT